MGRALSGSEHSIVCSYGTGLPKRGICDLSFGRPWAGPLDLAVSSLNISLLKIIETVIAI